MHRHWLPCLTALLLLAPPAAAQSPARAQGSAERVKYTRYRDAAGRFEIDYPARGWRLIPPGDDGSVLFTREKGPSLGVEHSQLPEPLTAVEAEILPIREVQRVRRQDELATGFRSDPVRTGAGRGVLISYTRPGRVPESVLLCTLVVGRDLFRLSATVPEPMIPRYGTTLRHMIESFTSPARRKVPSR